MKLSSEKFVWKVRNWIICIGLVALIAACFLGKLRAEDAFWPPDLIPHPTPPWDQPRDDDGRELA